MRAFAGVFTRWIGVDVSPDSLAYAAKTAADCGVAFEPVLVSVLDNPREVLQSVRADAAFCVTVIQHMPSWEYADDVLFAMRDTIPVGAPCVVQTRERELAAGAYKDGVCAWLTTTSVGFAARAARLGFEWIGSSKTREEYDIHKMRRAT
jgi:hypothetical protein